MSFIKMEGIPFSVLLLRTSISLFTITPNFIVGTTLTHALFHSIPYRPIALNIPAVNGINSYHASTTTSSNNGSTMMGSDIGIFNQML